MKKYLFNKSSVMSVVSAIVISIVVAAQVPVQSASAIMAYNTGNKELDTYLKSINTETDRQLEVLKTLEADSAINGTGNKTDTGVNGTKSDKDKEKECSAEIPKEITEGSAKEVNDQQAKLTGINKTLTERKTLGSAQQAAAEVDGNYEEFHVTASKSAVVDNLCKTTDGKKKLEQLINETKAKQEACKDEAAKSKEGEKDSKTTADKKSSGSSESSGSGGGGGGDKTQQIIALAVKLLTAIVAIIASIVALILAIQSGDYAAATILLQTIMGQLSVIANIITEAIKMFTEGGGGGGGGGASGCVGGTFQLGGSFQVGGTSGLGASANEDGASVNSGLPGSKVQAQPAN